MAKSRSKLGNAAWKSNRMTAGESVASLALSAPRGGAGVPRRWSVRRRGASGRAASASVARKGGGSVSRSRRVGRRVSVAFAAGCVPVVAEQLRALRLVDVVVVMVVARFVVVRCCIGASSGVESRRVVGALRRPRTPVRATVVAGVAARVEGGNGGEWARLPRPGHRPPSERVRQSGPSGGCGGEGCDGACVNNGVDLGVRAGVA